jgi:hypothetical protein
MVTIARSRLRRDARAAAVTLLKAYAAAAGVKLQVYPGRPASLFPPTAFVDRMPETDESFTVRLNQRTLSVEVLLVHGLFDSLEAVTQADDFADEFLDWVTDNSHAAGANTLIRVSGIEDIPAWEPDWRPANRDAAAQTYYATRITLEGCAGG